MEISDDGSLNFRLASIPIFSSIKLAEDLAQVSTQKEETSLIN